MMFKNNSEEKKVFDFYYTELPAISEYLEKQESEGYRFKEIKFDRTMLFEKSEPRKTRYFAEIFKGSTPDDFIESCALKGWEFVGEYNDELYIFRTQAPDAVNIKTDEKEKLRICAKRIMRQPGRVTFLGFAIVGIFRLISTINSGIETVLFEANVLNFYSLMLIGLCLFVDIIKIFDYFLWKFKILRKHTISQFGGLKNTIRKRRIYAFSVGIYLILGYLIILWIDPGFFVSNSDIENALIILFSFCCILFSLNHFLLSKLSFNKKDKVKRIIRTLIVTTVIICGLFAIGEYNQKRSDEFSKGMLSLEDIPISLTDLGDQAKECKDKGSVKGTRFGQFYRFTSTAERYEEDENTSEYMSYNILVSDYPNVRQRFIDKILEEYSELEFDFVKITSPDTEWDYYCRVKKDGANEYEGFAVKGDVVFYLRWSVQCEKDFFEVAYEKLFVE